MSVCKLIISWLGCVKYNDRSKKKGKKGHWRHDTLDLYLPASLPMGVITIFFASKTKILYCPFALEYPKLLPLVPEDVRIQCQRFPLPLVTFCFAEKPYRKSVCGNEILLNYCPLDLFQPFFLLFTVLQIMLVRVFRKHNDHIV